MTNGNRHFTSRSKRLTTNPERGRRLTAAVVGLPGMRSAASSGASATSAVPLRRLVASTVTFASDGSRYVAWQTRVGAPVVVFDTRTGAQRRLDLPVGCELANEEQRHNGRDAAAGRFLLSCRGGRSLESALLNGRDGTTIRLPNTADWTAVGTRYVLGVSEASTCVQSRNELAIGEEHGLPCLALYDLASSQGSYRSHSLWPAKAQEGEQPGVVSAALTGARHRPGGPPAALPAPAPGAAHRTNKTR